MKYLLTFILFSFFLLPIYSQNTTVFTPAQYEQLKSSGQLPAGNHIISYPAPDTTATPASNGGNRSGGCGCYIEPDAGYTLAMAPNDDNSSALINLPFTFCLYGDNYTSLYINNNGNVSFGTSYGTFSSTGFPSASYSMVAPFWADVDTRPVGGGEVWYKITATAIYVNWVDVGYYSYHTDKLNTFQLILTDGSDPIAGIGNNVAFCYEEMQWTTGDASSGVNGFGGTPSTVGSNRGNGVDFIQFGRFDQAGGTYDGPFGNSDGIDWLDYATFKFNTCVSGSNIAPIIAAVSPSSSSGSGSGIACGDTLNICGANDTLILSATFIAPENGQNISITASAPTLTNFQILSTTPAPNATITMMVISDPSDAGFNLIDISATDDGTPAMTTNFPISIYIDTTGISNLNPSISGPDFICPNASTTLSTSGVYDSYLWSDGSIGTSISVSDTGSYWLTVELNGCYASTEHYLQAVPGSVPVIIGDSTACSLDLATLTTTLDYVTYTWSTTSNNDSIFVGAGSYTVTVTDTNGCTGVSDPFIVTVLTLNPVISGDQIVCSYSPSTLSTTSVYNTYLWTGGSTSSSITAGSGTYTVTVTDANGCSGTSLPFVVSYSVPTATITGNQPICYYDQTLLTVLGGSFDSYLWSNGSSNSSTTVPPGNYYVIVTDSIGCIDTSATFTVNSFPEPVANFTFLPPSGTSFAGDTILFIDSSIIIGGNIVDWDWYFGDGNDSQLQNPFHSYVLPGSYPVTLVITSDDGCYDTLTLIYVVIPQEITVPNVFTPNSTPGINDYLVFTNLEYFPNSVLTIYDRWGIIVYESSNYQNNWDGKHYKNLKPLTDGTYYFILQVSDTDSSIHKGTVTILNK